MNHRVLGARGPIADVEAVLRKIHDWVRGRGEECLAIDARAVFGKDHLESAIRHGERAKAMHAMRARSLAVETLLYLTGHRQVVDAIRVAGLRNDTSAIGLVVWGADDPEALVRDLGWTRDDAVLEPTGKSLEILGITKQEEGTVAPDHASDLALERVSLLDIEN